MFRWLDNLALLPMAFVAILVALMPFHPRPHLYDKLAMLFQGQLQRPIDIFDLVIHSALLVLLIAKLLRMALKPGEPADDGSSDNA